MCIQIALTAVRIINKVINLVETKSITLAKIDKIIIIKDAAAKDLDAVFASLESILTKIIINTAIKAPGKNQLSVTSLTQLNKSTELVIFPGELYAILNLTAFQKS